MMYYMLHILIIYEHATTTNRLTYYVCLAKFLDIYKCIIKNASIRHTNIAH